MDYIAIAKLFSIVSIVLAIGILFHLNDAVKLAKELITGASGYILGGVLPIVFGAWTLTATGPLKMDWRLVVFSVGAFMLIAGCYRVLFVTHWRSLMHRHVDKIPALFALFGLMLGVILFYIGFIMQYA